jgi:predicted ATPase
MGEQKRSVLRFTEIHLRNWRNFLSVDVPLQWRAFLVGPNASEKSNFLDVFRFLSDIVTVGGGFQEAVLKRGGVSRLRCLATRRNPDIVVHVCLDKSDGKFEWEYELHFSQKQPTATYYKERKGYTRG